MNDSADRARAFRALHEGPDTFVIPNPWDAGSAVLLQRAGALALATTSAGYAFSTARADGTGAIGREEVLAHSRDILAATPLPVSADLENGYGDDPETCAETIRLAGEAGLAGGSIEDVTGDPAAPIHPFDLALARVQAAIEAARRLPHPFTLCTRADNLIHGRPDLSDTIRRLEAFADAGADVLYAPGLKTRDEVLAVVKAVAPKPVNVVVGLAGANFTVAELADLGVRRISLGSTLARLVYGRLMSAASEMFEAGSFGFSADAIPFGAINDVFRHKS